MAKKKKNDDLELDELEDLELDEELDDVELDDLDLEEDITSGLEGEDEDTNEEEEEEKPAKAPKPKAKKPVKRSPAKRQSTASPTASDSPVGLVRAALTLRRNEVSSSGMTKAEKEAALSQLDYIEQVISLFLG